MRTKVIIVCLSVTNLVPAYAYVRQIELTSQVSTKLQTFSTDKFC